MPSRGGQQGVYLSPSQVTVAYGSGTGADWFGPLKPMTPIAPPEVAGRQWDFQPGFNLAITPRVNEQIGFQTLRALADGYDLLRLLIETRKDQVARMKWSIRPRDLKTAIPNDPRLARLTALLNRPDGFHNWIDWLRILLEDLFVIDAPALYLQRDRGGQLIAMLPIDGATIKPVIDDWGRTPQPYQEGGAIIYPTAYQQVLKGCPAVDYCVRDLIYRPRNLRVHRAYGFGPVEQIVATINIALRKQLFTLEYYASGNIPDSLIGVPDTWTPDQITAYQKYWDAYIEGDLGRRRKAKFVPGGMSKTFIQTKEPDLKNDFDEWLARVCCFAFSISPQAFIRQMNRASAETQKDLSEEEGLAPILLWLKSLMDDVIEREFDAADLEFAWGADTLIDENQQATILSGYVKIGVMTINEARLQLGRPPLRDAAASTAMTLTTAGYQPIGAALSPNENGGTGPPHAAEGARSSSIADGGGGPSKTVEGASAFAGFAKFSPDQPRVPAGGPGGGQWTSGDSGGGASAPAGSNGGASSVHGARVTPAQFLPPILAEPPILPPVGEGVEPSVPIPPPPLAEWPTDPTVPPGPGWVWRGGPKGAWYDEENDQSLRPDFDNAKHVPHWDWRTPGRELKYRWFKDGTLEFKPR